MTRARRLALQGLCCLDTQGGKVLDLIDDFVADSNEGDEINDTARDLLRHAWAQHEIYDGILKRHARNWELTRLALVDRNILRLATHELYETPTPFRVVISEAMALAREFSTAESPRFINGILDAIAREIHADTEPEARPQE